MNANKKRTLTRAGRIVLYTLIIISFALSYVYLGKVKAERFRLTNDLLLLEYRVDNLSKRVQENREDLETLQKSVYPVNSTEVLFTNYGLWDKHSGRTTASGLTISDFETNDQGWYTYKGMVVLATAHDSLGSVKKGYITHALYDIVYFEIDGDLYVGQVLDKCGACTWGINNEKLQRYDIFTTHNNIGKTKGYIIQGGNY